MTGVFPGFLERYGDRLEPAHVALLEAFLPRLGDVDGPTPRPPHRRPRRLPARQPPVHPGDPAPVVVDYQTVTWGSGAYDLAYFVGGCLEPEVRRAHADDLMAGYHAALVADGVDGLPAGPTCGPTTGMSASAAW